MLIKVQNRAMVHERISVGENVYPTDGRGFAIVEDADAKVLVEIAGFKRIGEVNGETIATEVPRLPETPDEFIQACRRAGLRGRDLRQMADYLDAHERLDFIPDEGEAPNLPMAVEEVASPQPARPASAEPVANVPDPEDWGRYRPPEDPEEPEEQAEPAPEAPEAEPEPEEPQAPQEEPAEPTESPTAPEVPSEFALRSMPKSKLRELAVARGVEVDGRWSKSRLVRRIQESAS